MLRTMEILFAQQKQFRIHLQVLFDVSKRIVVGNDQARFDPKLNHLLSLIGLVATNCPGACLAKACISVVNL